MFQNNFPFLWRRADIICVVTGTRTVWKLLLCTALAWLAEKSVELHLPTALRNCRSYTHQLVRIESYAINMSSTVYDKIKYYVFLYFLMLVMFC